MSIAVEEFKRPRKRRRPTPTTADRAPDPRGTCPSLVDLAGDQYRVTCEAPLGEPARLTVHTDSWSMLIPTRFGSIRPYSWDTLAVWLAGRRPGLVKALVTAGCRVWTEGDDGTTLLAHVGLFGRVAEIVGARKRRKLSAAQRVAAVERLARFSFAPAAQSDKSGEFGPGTPRVDSQATPAGGGQ